MEAPPGVVPSAEAQHPVSGRSYAEVFDQPVVWHGVDLGPCVTAWKDKTYLKSKIGHLRSSFHYSADTPDLDFENRNFKYIVAHFGDVLDLMDEGGTAGSKASELPKADAAQAQRLEPGFYYYRATSLDRKAASMDNTLEPLKDDFKVPEQVCLESACYGSSCVDKECGSGAEKPPKPYAVYSTVVRMCSPRIRIWLHYDVCDNIICQITGRKRVVLFPPSVADKLELSDSSSRLGARCLSLPGVTGQGLGAEKDVNNVTPSCIKNFPPSFLDAWKERYEVVLEPGDVLRIPALWGHCTEDVRRPTHSEVPDGEARDAGSSNGEEHGIGISVNIFFKTQDLEPFYANKDAWCNVDYTPYREGSKLVDKALGEVRKLPCRAREFYLLRLRAKIDEQLLGLDS